MGKGGADIVLKEREHKRSILIRCRHCDKITTMDWERTTADEFNATMASYLEQKGVLKEGSLKNRLAPLHRIKGVLDRLKNEMGYGIKESK